MWLLPSGGRLLGGSCAPLVIGSRWPGLDQAPGCPGRLIRVIAQQQPRGWVGATALPPLWAQGSEKCRAGHDRSGHGLKAELPSRQRHPQRSGGATPHCCGCRQRRAGMRGAGKLRHRRGAGPPVRVQRGPAGTAPPLAPGLPGARLRSPPPPPAAAGGGGPGGLGRGGEGKEVGSGDGTQ